MKYHADKINKELEKIPYGVIERLVGDAAGQQRSHVDMSSVFDHYAEYGVYWQPSTKKTEDSIMKQFSYFETGNLKIMDNCVELITELSMYKFPERSLDKEVKNEAVYEKPIAVNDHLCFVAGTLIETNKGLIPIEKVKIGEYVQTRQGYKKVYDSARTGINKEVKRVILSNGKELVGTGNHPVWVEGKGFTAIDNLQYGDTIKVSNTWRLLNWWRKLNIKEEHTEDTQIPTTYQHKDTSGHLSQQARTNTTTGECTRIIWGKFQKGIMFIIRMEILTITKWKTLKLYLQKNTYKSIISEGSTISNIWHVSDLSQKNGTEVKRESNGILKTDTMHGISKKKLRKHAKYALNITKLKPTIRDSAPTTVSQRGEGSRELTMKYVIVDAANKILRLINIQRKNIAIESVQTEEELRDVYNISIEQAHEYYANGVLVSNCDSLRYIIAELPDDPSQLINHSYNAHFEVTNSRRIKTSMPDALQSNKPSYSNSDKWMVY